MKDYVVEYADFMKVKIQARNLKEAHAKAAMLDDEEIQQKAEKEDHLMVWNVREV